MRLTRRRDRDVHRHDAVPDEPDDDLRRHDGPAGAEGDDVRDEVIETELHTPARWGIPAVLTAAAGVALAVLGVTVLVRAGVDGTWYSPVVEVGGMDHTPLLGAIEIGVGAVLVLAALAGARILAAFVALAAAVAAAVVAVEPDTVERELAIERGWAVLLAAGFLVLGLLILVLGQGARHERRVEHRPVRPGPART